MFITKKDYKELIELRDRYRDLAERTIKNNEELLEELKDINELNKKILHNCSEWHWIFKNSPFEMWHLRDCSPIRNILHILSRT